MSVLRTAQQQGADAVARLADLARAPTPTVMGLAFPGARLA